MKPADLVEVEKETLATLEAMDNDQPYTSALIDVKAFSVLRYYGGWADKNYGQTIRDESRQIHLHQKRAGWRVRLDHSVSSNV
jgi:acyl-CoA reductase-like NAD-dependent aldehyde dehydrogenase